MSSVAYFRESLIAGCGNHHGERDRPDSADRFVRMFQRLPVTRAQRVTYRKVALHGYRNEREHTDPDRDTWE